MSQEDKKKTAFTTFVGLYEFNAKPFGSCTAPAALQRLMNAILGGLTDYGISLPRGHRCGFCGTGWKSTSIGYGRCETDSVGWGQAQPEESSPRTT